MCVLVLRGKFGLNKSIWIVKSKGCGCIFVKAPQVSLFLWITRKPNYPRMMKIFRNACISTNINLLFVRKGPFVLVAENRLSYSLFIMFSARMGNFISFEDLQNVLCMPVVEIDLFTAVHCSVKWKQNAHGYPSKTFVVLNELEKACSHKQRSSIIRSWLHKPWEENALPLAWNRQTLVGSNSREVRPWII